MRANRSRLLALSPNSTGLYQFTYPHCFGWWGDVLLVMVLTLVQEMTGLSLGHNTLIVTDDFVVFTPPGK
jgi:hypothetical protein